MLFSEYLKKFKNYEEADLMAIDVNEAIDIENKYIKEFYNYCNDKKINLVLNDLDRYYL